MSDPSLTRKLSAEYLAAYARVCAAAAANYEAQRALDDARAAYDDVRARAEAAIPDEIRAIRAAVDAKDADRSHIGTQYLIALYEDREREQAAAAAAIAQTRQTLAILRSMADTPTTNTEKD
jgi:hypothetical protein